MQTTVKQRVRMAMDAVKLSIPAIARQASMSERTLQDQMKGDTKVSVQLLEALLSSNTQISAEWLMRGVGEMLIDSNKIGSVKCSGDHINGNGNATRGGVVNTPCNDELIRLRTEVEYLKQQVSELKEDKKTLIELLKK